MSYFSRLTDIVTCNLSELLARDANPQAALERIIEEIRTGVAGAQRSVRTACHSEQAIRLEIEEHTQQLPYWTEKARQELKAGRDDEARIDLMRKREVEDLIAGLKQQHQAALSTVEHLKTTLHALEARLADAIRRRAAFGLDSPVPQLATGEIAEQLEEFTSFQHLRQQQIEDELAALRREMSPGGQGA
jgi:phage shock protein A